jgi:hypothetical protein
VRLKKFKPKKQLSAKQRESDDKLRRELENADSNNSIVSSESTFRSSNQCHTMIEKKSVSEHRFGLCGERQEYSNFG